MSLLQVEIVDAAGIASLLHTYQPKLSELLEDTLH